MITEQYIYFDANYDFPAAGKIHRILSKQGEAVGFDTLVVTFAKPKSRIADVSDFGGKSEMQYLALVSNGQTLLPSTTGQRPMLSSPSSVVNGINCASNLKQISRIFRTHSLDFG